MSTRTRQTLHAALHHHHAMMSAAWSVPGVTSD